MYYYTCALIIYIINCKHRYCKHYKYKYYIGQNDIPSLQIQFVEYIQDKNLIKELESFLRKEVHSYTIIP